MAVSLTALFAFRDLRAFPLTAMHLVMATRLCILYGQAGRDPLPDLAVRLRSMEAARRVARLVRGLQQDWPEHFLVHRPCCMTLTPDEAALAELAMAATDGNEATGVALLGDMIPPVTARRLFAQAVAAAAAIQSAALMPDRRD